MFLVSTIKRSTQTCFFPKSHQLKLLKVLFLVLLVSFSCCSQAQFNDSTHYYVKYGITGIYNRTETDRSFVVNNNAAFTVKKKKIAFNSSAGWIYGEQNHMKTNNDVSAGLNVDVLKDQQRLYYWGLANFVSSYSLNINYQAQIGGGLGYNFVNKPQFELVVSDGLLYEASEVKDDAGIRDSYQTVRNSLRLKHRWIINNLITLEGSHFWQPSLKNAKDYIVRSSTSLSFKLYRWLSVSSSLVYNRISRTDRENLLINFGLVAETYFH